MRSRLVSVVVVNLDGQEYLEPLLKSLTGQTMDRDRFEVIVVDNGSRDGSAEYLRRDHPGVKVVRNDRNQGFAGPCNQGAGMAAGKYLAFVNNDMRLAPNWLEVLTGHLEAAPDELACAGSLILDWEGRHVDFAGGTLAFNGMGFQTRFGEPAAGAEAGGYPVEIPFACGGAMLVRRDVFLAAGGFDADYFAYLEDVDFGWRLWVLGYRVEFCPQAVAYHRHHGTAERFAFAKRLVLLERNALFSVIKNYGDEALARVLPAALLLTFNRVATRSAIPADAFRLDWPQETQHRPMTARRSGAPLRPALRRLALRIRERGLRTGLRELGVKVARRVLDRWGPALADPMPPIRAEGYSAVVAMAEVARHLPALLEKRRDIQQRRRRPDSDVFARFGAPFTPVEPDPAYRAAQAAIVEALGLDRLFSGVGGSDGDQAAADGSAGDRSGTEGFTGTRGAEAGTGARAADPLRAGYAP